MRARALTNGCSSQNPWRFLAWARLPPLVGVIRTAPSETLHPQYTALPVRPARIPTRSTHQPAHSFDFDSLALCLHSGRGHAHVHPWAFMVVRGRPESRTFKRNSPIILYLLTGGGVRVVARTGDTRHAHRTTHRWWGGGGVLVGFDLARCVCVWWGARVVESASDGGIVHTRDATCET